MTEETVVAKVGDLMATLDDVKTYREFANAMVDFAGIITASLVAAFAFLILYDIYEVVAGPAPGTGLLWSSLENGLGFLVILLILTFGLAFGAFWVNRRVKRTKIGEWQETLKEGTPGALKLLEETDWDSTLQAISLSRVAYFFYALTKVGAYSILVFFLLFFVGGVSGIWGILQTSTAYVAAISVTIVLLFMWRSVALGYRRMQSLDLLFWDLRWFSTEFKRAEFNKA